MMATIPRDRLLAAKKPVSRKVRIATDCEIADEADAARQAFTDARSMFQITNDDRDRAKLDQAEARQDAALSALEAASIEFTVTACGRARFEELLHEHEPPEDVKVRARERNEAVPDFDPKTFGPALIAECVSVDGEKLGLDDALTIWNSDEWSAGEVELLWSTAMMLCQSRRVVDLKKG